MWTKWLRLIPGVGADLEFRAKLYAFERKRPREYLITVQSRASEMAGSVRVRRRSTSKQTGKPVSFRSSSLLL
jgi:hypothetical protein